LSRAKERFYREGRSQFIQRADDILVVLVPVFVNESAQNSRVLRPEPEAKSDHKSTFNIVWVPSLICFFEKP